MAFRSTTITNRIGKFLAVESNSLASESRVIGRHPKRALKAVILGAIVLFGQSVVASGTEGLTSAEIFSKHAELARTNPAEAKRIEDVAIEEKITKELKSKGREPMPAIMNMLMPFYRSNDLVLQPVLLEYYQNQYAREQSSNPASAGLGAQKHTQRDKPTVPVSSKLGEKGQRQEAASTPLVAANGQGGPGAQVEKPVGVANVAVQEETVQKSPEKTATKAGAPQPPIDDPIERARIMGRMETSVGVEAAKVYIKMRDDKAGGDGDISVAEAPEFAKNALAAHVLSKLHEYDQQFPNGSGTVATPSFSIFPQKTVKPRGDYEREWKEIVCEKKNPFFIVLRDAKNWNYSISDDAVRAGVTSACSSKS